MALAACLGARISIPAERVRFEPAFLGSLEGAPAEAQRPFVPINGRVVDLRQMPGPESRELHFYYALDLQEGWCAIHRPDLGIEVGLAFPREVFSNCWLFASYGGWRDYYVAVLEPCTGYPFRLEDAISAGTCSSLGPHQWLETEVVFSARRAD